MIVQASSTQEWADRVDAYVTGPVFSCKTFRCICHCGFTGIVPDETRSRSRGAGGGDIDY